MSGMLKVLVVEDEERIRKGLKKLLEELVGGYSVIAEGCNGKEGLELFEIHKPDILITDIRMPQMNGLDMIRHLRSKGFAVPVIILSGYDEFIYVRQALRDDVVDYILKPIDHAEFAKAVQKAKDQLLTAQNKDSMELSEEEECEESRVIRQIKKLVQQNLDKELLLFDIAEEVNLNYNYLSGLFKEQTGMNFSDYLIKERINKACRLLKDTNLKIYDISSLCGYSNTKYFMVLFKRITGETPSEYRENEHHSGAFIQN